MRKLITGASIILIFVAIYVLIKTVFAPHQLEWRSNTAVATTPTPNPNVLSSTTPTPDPIPQFTPAPTPAASTLEPLKSRLVVHQPDQFREGALGKDELTAIKNAIKSIPWSLNSNPEAAANEDYSAILKEWKNSGGHEFLANLIAEAAANDYQPDSEVASSAYSARLISDFENDRQNDSSNEMSTGEITVAQGKSVNSESPPAVHQPDVPATATSGPPAQQAASPEVARSKISHRRHRSTVRHRIVDAKTRLIELWHQSLEQGE